MTDLLALAESRLLAPGGLAVSTLDRAFDRLLGPGVDDGDLYFQHARRESWTIEDGIVKHGAHSIDQGLGVRAISGEKTGFAYSDDIRSDALLEAAGAARAIARSGIEATGGAPIHVSGRALYPALDPIDAMDADAKVAALRAVDRLLRAADPRVKQVTVSLAGGVETILLARSNGVVSGDIRPLVRFNVQVIVESNGRREQGFSGGGGRYGYLELFNGSKPEAWAREALRQALVNLDAVDAPAGAMQVVLGPGWPGVLLHEAVGHGLEGDFNRKGTSTFAGRIGQRVASKGVTIVDDGTMPGRRGSLCKGGGVQGAFRERPRQRYRMARAGGSVCARPSTRPAPARPSEAQGCRTRRESHSPLCDTYRTHGGSLRSCRIVALTGDGPLACAR